MFVRKKKNKSGSTSIQIIRKERGKNKVLETVGCSSNIFEIEILEKKAKKELSKYNEPSLFDKEKIPEITDLSNDSIRVIGPEKIFEPIYNKIGFGKIEEPLLKELVISRITHPGSKLRLSEYLRESGKTDTTVYSIYRFLDKLNSRLKKRIEDISFSYTKQQLGGEIGIVFYDITTIYFESSQPDDFRKAGFSKDGKHQNPQILLGLLVGKNAYPIGYEIFEGTRFEGHTLIPILEGFKKRFNLDNPIVVADAGLLSKDNIDSLVKNGYQYILGARIKNETNKVKQQIEKLKLKAEEISLIKKDKNTKLYISYSEKRAGKDKFNRERGLKRLENNLSKGRLTKSHINNRGYNKYLQIDGELEIKIDYEKFEKDEKWDGLKGYLTNTNLKGKEVIENYNNLWKIEKAFRVSKTDLKIRPIYHRLRKRIEAHICISFASYLLYKELERVIKNQNLSISITQAIESINKMYAVVFLNDQNVLKTIELKKNNMQTLIIEAVSAEF
ncbi:MAG: IS1634 family transposase [Ignavibacteriae bacterium]|nr:IS1634 family transposase [Ignavibacteriota bacterium]NOH00430.1 IS1634 family transposase [Ignavibacteriota bacterium]